jgi:transmembrane sensor
MNAPWKDRLERAFDLDEIDAVYHRLEHSLHEPPRRRHRVVAPVAIGAAAALALAAWFVFADSEAPRIAKTDPDPALPAALRVEGEAEAFRELASVEAVRVALSDGSVLELGPDVHLAARENSGEAFSLAMSRGVATFDVRPRGPRLWSIDAGTFVVEVIGTRFTIERAASFAEVRVDRGLVSVRGPHVPDGSRLLGAGQALRVPNELAIVEPENTGEAASMRSPADPTWRELASRGDYHEAYRRVESLGLAREVARAEDIETLFALADTARLSGHPADARPPLVRIVEEHPSDARAEIAAFTLGQIELRSLRRPDAAARWFERAIELGLTGSLREAAERRLAEIRGPAPP